MQHIEPLVPDGCEHPQLCRRIGSQRSEGSVLSVWNRVAERSYPGFRWRAVARSKHLGCNPSGSQAAGQSQNLGLNPSPYRQAVGANHSDSHAYTVHVRNRGRAPPSRSPLLAATTLGVSPAGSDRVAVRWPVGLQEVPLLRSLGNQTLKLGCELLRYRLISLPRSTSRCWLPRSGGVATV